MLKQILAFSWLSIFILFISSCRKEHPIPVTKPEMIYTTLDQAVTYLKSIRLDIDKDGTKDFNFGTYLVGDPQEGVDKLQFFALSGIQSSLLNDAGDQSPMLEKGQKISAMHTGYTWYVVSAILLAERVTPSTGDIFFRGTWKDAQHRFLPLQVTRNGKNYLGWIELSYQKETSTLLLHKAAISSIADAEVVAGQ